MNEEKEVKAWHCPECAQPMVPTQAGSCCPRGHGRIGPKMPADVTRRHTAIHSLRLKDARQSASGLWRVEGDDTDYDYSGVVNRLLLAWPSDVDREKYVLALDGTRIIKLKPHKYHAA